MKIKMRIMVLTAMSAALLWAGLARAEALQGEFLLLPIHALLQGDEAALQETSKTLFHLEDGTKITFVAADKAAEVKKTYQKRSLPEKAVFRMVVDELNGAPQAPALNTELTISLPYFMRDGLLGYDLDREGLSYSPLAGDLAQINPLLYAAMNGGLSKQNQRVLFHWEIKVGDRYLKIFLPQGGMQVSREVLLSKATS